MQVSSELDSRESLRVDDARNRPNLVDDDLAQDVEVLGLDFRNQVVLAEQRMQLDDFLDLQELVVDLVLLRGRGADQHETDRHLPVARRIPRTGYKGSPAIDPLSFHGRGTH